MPEPLPQHCPTKAQLDDLELLLIGAFAGTDHDALSLAVPPGVAEAAEQAGALQLVDPEGLPLATVEPAVVQDGVVTGPLTKGAIPAYGPFRRLHLTPDQVREQFPDAVSVPVAAPLTEDDLESIEDQRDGRPVVLLALCGQGTPHEVSSVGLLRASLKAAELLGDTTVVAVPLASRGDAQLDHALGQQVVANYAPGQVLAVTGHGNLPDEIESALAQERDAEPGVVLFFTGLSGSGKSTLARALLDLVLEAGERTVTSLDGDVVRRNLSAGLTFSAADRETNIRRIGWVGAEIARHGGVAICSPIAPFDSTRKEVRAMAEEAGADFVLIHVATPMEECERRDRKGLYAKARRGEIPEFTGISSPYEEPDDAEVRVDTTGRTIEAALADVLAALPFEVTRG